MIKITKSLDNIPESLKPAFADLFPDRIGRNVVSIPQQSNKTHKRRMQVIEAGFFPSQDPAKVIYITNDDNSTSKIPTKNYNSRYKLDDIRDALSIIYKGKCAFCEQKEELTHVEHFRPKDTYYWLAFSWDNLLMSCPTCNTHKSTNFEIDGVLANFENTELNIRNINSSSTTYDAIEIPKMVNPEVTDPNGLIYFEKDGSIKSENPRFSYTIETCKIDRKGLNDSRRSLLDRFREHIRDAFIINANEHDQEVAIITNTRNFIRDSINENEDFSAFRRYAIANDWMNDIIKDMN